MNLEITTRVGCSNNCVYCPQPALAKAYRQQSDVFEMSFDTYKACINKVPAQVVVDFSGMCEPFLNSHCTEMVEYAFNKGHQIRIFTTLIGMTPDHAKTLTKLHYQDSWGFVLHVPVAEKGLEHIPVTPRYIETLNILLNSKLKLQYHIHGKSPNPVVAQLIGKPIKYVRPNSISGHIDNTTVYPKLRTKFGKLWCSRIYQNVLLPNGDVLLCCQDYGMEHKIGNLLTDSYADLHRSPEFKRIIKGFEDMRENTLCRHCHFALNKDWVAKIMNFSLQKIDLP